MGDNKKGKGVRRFNNNPRRANREYKDGVFKLYFKEKDKTADLYSALTGEECSADDITIITLEDALSKNFVNDLAFVARGRALVVSEHMSSLSENMPLRVALYFGRIYEKYLGLAVDKRILYKQILLKIPTPEFVALYNGDEKMPEKQVLRLSDSFIGKNNPMMGGIELTVPVYNTR